MSDNKKIKVGFFCDTYLPMVDGVIAVMNNYISYLKDDFDFYLFVPKAHKGYLEKDFGQKDVIRCKKMKICFLDYDLAVPCLDRKFKKRLKEIKLDAVVLHSTFTIGKIGLKYAKKNNIPAMIFAHSLLYYDFLRAAKSKLIAKSLLRKVTKMVNKTDLLIAVGEGVKKVYRDDYKVTNRIKVINNATDFTFLNNDKLINDLKQKHNIKDDEKVYLFVGRINKLKNIYFTADSLKILKDKNHKYKMFFIGVGRDTVNFKKYLKKLGIEDNCIFTGKVTDKELLRAYYQMADIFLFPSYYDTNSLVQKEAASQKTPTLFIEGITTATGFTDKLNCFISKATPVDFANKIIEVTSDSKLLKEVSNNAYKDMYVTWDKSSQRLKETILYEIERKKKN